MLRVRPPASGLCAALAALYAACGSAAQPPPQHGVVLFLPETPDEAVRDLVAIKRDGLNMVKIASWVWTVPTEGSALRETVDATLDWCDRNEMAVWLLHNIQFGSPGEGGDIEKALTDPLSDARRSLDPWARVLRGHPCVAGVLLGNEVSPGGVERFEKRPAYLAAFQAWLEKRHGRIDTLNQRWGTQFASFGDVQVPGEIGSGTIDVQRFNREQFARFYNSLARDILRPVLGDCLCGSKGGASPYILRQMPDYSVASWDDLLANWPLWKTKLLVDTTGLPVFNSELHLYHGAYGFGPSAELSRYRYFTSALLGEWMTASFAWGAWQEPEIAQIHSHTPGILSDLQAVEPVLRSMGAQAPQFSVLVTEANEEGVQGHPPLEVAYAHAAASGLPWEFVTDLDVPALAGGLALVDTAWLTEKAARALLEFAGRGDVVFVGDAPASDEYGLPLPPDLTGSLRAASHTIEGWGRLRDLLPCPAMPSEFREIVDVDYLWWSPDKGHHHFKVKYPRLESWAAPHPEYIDVVVVNHTREAVTSCVPFADDGSTVLDLISGDVVAAAPLALGPLAVRVLRVE